MFIVDKIVENTRSKFGELFRSNKHSNLRMWSPAAGLDQKSSQSESWKVPQINAP